VFTQDGERVYVRPWKSNLKPVETSNVITTEAALFDYNVNPEVFKSVVFLMERKFFAFGTYFNFQNVPLDYNTEQHPTLLFTREGPTLTVE